MTASLICSVGGAQINKVGNVSPEPISDCPPLPDPLASRPPPPEAADGCTFNKFKIDGGAPVQPLKPGVYCGGLTITGDAHVRLSGGTYVIRNGAFSISQTAVVEGQDVGFYLQGNKSVIDFSGNTTIRLSGPESGPMAGLLFFEDRAAPTNNKHHIASTNADTLVGTIYLSRGELFVDPDAPVAAKSAYTAIIANQVTLSQGPELVLNADYGATQVPVPPGIAASGSVVLAE
jgi:hypothetical protein